MLKIIDIRIKDFYELLDSGVKIYMENGDVLVEMIEKIGLVNVKVKYLNEEMILRVFDLHNKITYEFPNSYVKE